MRHLKIGRKLNRNSKHRKAMFRNMVTSLILHEIIKTTLPKAKELRRFIEPIINIAKIDSVANRRLIFSYIRNNNIINKIFTKISPNLIKYNGGYTKILKCGFRNGDNAPIAYIKIINNNKK